MRVAWNLLFLRPGVVGGTESYAAALADGLAAHAPTVEVSLYALAALGSARPDLVAGRAVHPAPVSGRVRPARVVAETTWLAARLRRDRPDVVHHLGGTVPALGGPVPAVVTIHDLQPLDHPEHFSALKRAFLRRALPAAVRRAAVVCTPSQQVRARVIERLGADPDRVVVVPVGWIGPTRPPAPVEPGPGLPARYVLYPAITYPHKDHVTLVRALAGLPEDVGLVLTGGVGPAEAALWAEADRLGVRHRVRRPGRVPAGVLAGLFASASVVAVPSRYEGFGIPVVEAFRAGVPVVAADATCLPEVVGDAGLLVPPGDVAAWRAALSTVLGDPARAAALIERGRARLAAHGPGSIVAAQVAAYERAAGP
jgi:glycosyltransferase involved in cell wall biosynthesis